MNYKNIQRQNSVDWSMPPIMSIQRYQAHKIIQENQSLEQDNAIAIILDALNKKLSKRHFQQLQKFPLQLSLAELLSLLNESEIDALILQYAIFSLNLNELQINKRDIDQFLALFEGYVNSQKPELIFLSLILINNAFGTIIDIQILCDIAKIIDCFLKYENIKNLIFILAGNCMLKEQSRKSNSINNSFFTTTLTKDFFNLSKEEMYFLSNYIIFTDGSKWLIDTVSYYGEVLQISNSLDVHNKLKLMTILYFNEEYSLFTELTSQFVNNFFSFQLFDLRIEKYSLCFLLFLLK
ncbi:hypothetical protein TRFO_13930 [Tritrichomonas foetus]|uniref:Uncharacterized protein n=1 Tax=Tritrichomonas foetus TaxID=1144522 RepID=A0A1J4L0X1_9EUKA|nr:hypothetical protein TRFO_13930 [Tritrichomonas foetus]|eukprot:OHT15614.1 hypothetical protein TRFO_13930 [Tritrichomonas foetus]